jgi:NAD(P)-dependent dehydrogenase (short-subunit alcohol dehydrogenase family)
LFNNAGVQTRKTIWESTLADWEWVININLWGVIHGVRIFVPMMLQQQTECYIVNTASSVGLISGPGTGTYRVTKHAVVSLSETLYLELRQRNAPIGVSVLCPSFVRSRLNEAERNRPAKLRNPPGKNPPTPEEQALERFFQEMNQGGITPQQCAELVFKAIQNNTFYILTHPELRPAIQKRMENILQGRNPTLPQIPRR